MPAVLPVADGQHGSPALIQLLPAQKQAFWAVDKLGMALLLWRRQFGKTTTLSALALRRMMERPWHLVTYASASLLVGRELILREAELWRKALDQWRIHAEANKLQLSTSGDGLEWDDFLDVFSHNRLEARLYHSRTSYSRTQIIAPNAATARGFTGDVMIDEIGFIRDFRELWEAMEPIASRDPSFRVVMATTPPEDDSHFSYELSSPKEIQEFQPKAEGHWYESESGVVVHRCDVYDAWESGVKLYDLNTRAPLSPAEHRSRAINREAWDRNYALIFKSGGTAACTLQTLHTAMVRGRDLCIAAEDDFPSGWRRLLGDGTFAVGLDLATTEGKKSNPSSLTIAEKIGRTFVLRLIVRWKTADPDKTRAMAREGISLADGTNQHRRCRRLSIDATNERFFATQLRREFAGICPVELVIASEGTEYAGEKMIMKNYLGNLLVNHLDDNLLSLPDERWVKEDWRLVKKERGSFVAEVDPEGNHADTFDSSKLALHGLVTGAGPVEIKAVAVGGISPGKGSVRWKNRAGSSNRTRINA